MTFISRELDRIQEGLKALQRSVEDGRTAEATLMIHDLLNGTARLIQTCNAQRKPVVALPDPQSRRSFI